MGYQGPHHGTGNRDFVSVGWLGGEVRGASRVVEYPIPTAYSIAVARRIRKRSYKAPAKDVASILGWPKTATRR